MPQTQRYTDRQSTWSSRAADLSWSVTSADTDTWILTTLSETVQPMLSLHEATRITTSRPHHQNISLCNTCCFSLYKDLIFLTSHYHWDSKHSSNCHAVLIWIVDDEDPDDYHSHCLDSMHDSGITKVFSAEYLVLWMVNDNLCHSMLVVGSG